MKGITFLAIASRVFCRLDAREHRRPFEKQFAIKVGTGDQCREIDFRDLSMSQSFSSMHNFPRSHDEQNTSALECLEKMNEAYEDALSKVQKCACDTFKKFNEAVVKQLKDDGQYSLFEKDWESTEFNISTADSPPEILHAVFRLMSGWCEKLDIAFDLESAAKILRAYEILEISGEKEIDVFLMNDDKPHHLRVKQNSLFCINFVYLLQRNEELYNSCYNLIRFTDREYLTKDGHIQIKRDYNMGLLGDCSSLPLLPVYVNLLRIEKENKCVESLFLGTGSNYFVYKMQPEENCLVIRLQHKNDEDSVYKRLNLIDMLCTSNKSAINIRLEVLAPFFDTSVKREKRWRLKMPSDFKQIFYSNLDFMAIPLGTTEVYINNMMSVTLPDEMLPGDECRYASVDDAGAYLVLTVKTALSTISELSGLLIRGFNRFPEQLVPLLQKTNLRKFGAMSFYGCVDYIVMSKLFREESLLKNSIRHFVGHYRALYLLSYFYKNWKIKEATLTCELFGIEMEYFTDEKQEWERIKAHFENTEPHRDNKVKIWDRIVIDTVYHLDSAFLALPLQKSLFRNPCEDRVVQNNRFDVVLPEEVLERFEIAHLVVKNKSNYHFEFEEYTVRRKSLAHPLFAGFGGKYFIKNCIKHIFLAHKS
ncbi:hypothetical protein ENBRE01_1819 [Enteropsectra breve]|nr:hypothetical protein ENBRE01_1819 [Enteropsectra breve]